MASEVEVFCKLVAQSMRQSVPRPPSGVQTELDIRVKLRNKWALSPCPRELMSGRLAEELDKLECGMLERQLRRRIGHRTCFHVNIGRITTSCSGFIG